MSERLTDEQIAKADKKLRSYVRAMLDGKQAINRKDFERNGWKRFEYAGSVTVRQLLRVISDLRHYKQLAEERGKALTIVRDTLQHKKNDDRTSWGLWDLSNKSLGKEQNNGTTTD